MERKELIHLGLWLAKFLGVTKVPRYGPFKILLVFLPIISIVIFNVLEFCETHDFDAVTRLVFNITVTMQGSARLYFLMKHRNTFIEICDNFKKLQNQCYTDISEKNDKLYSKILDYTKLYLKLCFISYLFYITKPISATQSRTFWNWRMSTMMKHPYFEIILCLEVVCGLIFFLVYFSVNIIAIGLITELVLNLNALKNGIKTAIQRYVDDEDKDRKCMELLSKCVEYHVGIIRLATKIKSLLSIVLLFITSAPVIIQCFALYDLHYDKSADLSRISYSVLLFAGSIIDLFPACFLGMIFTNQLLSVSEAIYETGWWEYKYAHVGRTLSLMMHRSQRPLYFTAFRGVFNIDLRLFISILKSGYSLYTVLQAMEMDDGK